MPYSVGSHKRRKPLTLPMARSPGKFEGELRISEFVWDLTLEGFADEELGDVQDFGYYSLVSLGPEAVDDIARAAREANVELTPAERQLIRENSGAIVSEDNYGFVHVEYYDSKKKLDQSWSRLEESYRGFTMEDDELGEFL